MLLAGDYIEAVKRKENILKENIRHPAICNSRTAGLWMSLQFATVELNQSIVHQCVKNGLITDWFLFAPDRLRIAPPLIMTDEALTETCNMILESINQVLKKPA